MNKTFRWWDSKGKPERINIVDKRKETMRYIGQGIGVQTRRGTKEKYYASGGGKEKVLRCDEDGEVNDGREERRWK